MAREYKRGIDFFARSSDFFDQSVIKRLMKNYGATGVIVYEYLEASAHKSNGYYVAADIDLFEDIADFVEADVEKITTVIKYMRDRKLFYVLSHSEHGTVITSEKWQRDFLPVAQERARKRDGKQYFVDEEIWLLPESETGNTIVPKDMSLRFYDSSVETPWNMRGNSVETPEPSTYSIDR